MQMWWGSYVFVHLKMGGGGGGGGLHKIVQPFLTGHVFLCIPISVRKEQVKYYFLSNGWHNKPT